MDALLAKLAAHRRRLRLARTAGTAIRWAFYASVAACAGIAASKLAGLRLPLALAATALAAVPLGMAVREWSRSFSLRDCAIHLDRTLRLEERLATALEAPGSLGPVLVADAEGALDRAELPRPSLPREAKLLAGSLLALGGLLVIPAPDLGGPAGDPAYEAVLAEEAARLEGLSGVDVRFKEVAEHLKEGRAAEAVALLQEIREALERMRLDGAGGSGGRSQELIDRAAASAAAISAELARLGRTVHAPPPAIAQAKLERQRLADAGPDRAATGAGQAGLPAFEAVVLQSPTWDPRYDSVIRRYFGRAP